MQLFRALRIPTDKIPECKPHIKAGEYLKLYRFSEKDFTESGAVFNGPHPETGEDLFVAEEPHPEGAPAHDLPPQLAVFAPSFAPEEIVEIANTLRDKAGLPKQPAGNVAEVRYGAGRPSRAAGPTRFRGRTRSSRCRDGPRADGR
jgi:manganese catalase